MSAASNLLPVATAFERVTDNRPNASTIYRWSTRGSYGVVLRTWVVDGRQMTDIESVQYFLYGRAKRRNRAYARSKTEAQRKPKLNYSKVYKQLIRDVMLSLQKTQE